MKHEIEGSDLRACIDKAYDAGYNKAIIKFIEWIRNHHLLTELDVDDYIKFTRSG